MSILNSTFQGKAVDSEGGEHEIPSEQVLALRGPLLQVAISQSDAHQRALVERGEMVPAPISGLLLIDTGAASTCVDAAAAERGGLAVVDTGLMSSATHENHEVPVFAAKIDIPGFVAINATRCMGANLASQGIVALLGRDILRSTVLIYNGPAGTISISH